MRRTRPRDSATQTAALALSLGLALAGCGSDERSGAALSSGPSGSGASASVGGGGGSVGSGGGASSSSGTGGAGAGGGGNGGASPCDGTLGLPALPLWSVATKLAVDVNGDGKLDLIGGSVLVSINNGGGQYAPAVSYPTGAAGGSSVGLAAADLDGDGDVDFAATDVTLSALDVILNHGDGTFAAPYSFGNLYGSDQCAQSSDLAAADFDGDGAVDLAIQCSTGLLVKTNAGDGTFAAVGDMYPVPLNAPIAADFDDDGHPDVVAWGTDLSGQTAITVLLNDGTGTLLSPAYYPASYAGARLGVTDLDGDGIPDVVTGADFQSNVSVFLNDGSGTLGPRVDYFESGASIATAADLDEDGDADLVIGTSFSTVVVKPNQGDGTFGAATAYPTGKDGGSSFAVDLNDDGHLDLLVGSGGVLFNDGTGVFPSWIDYPVGIQPSVSVIAELNGDSLPDIAAVNTAYYPRVRVLFNTGGGAFDVGGDYPVGSVDAGDPVSIAAADFNGDGATDLVTANFASNTMSVLINHGDGTFAAKLDYPTSAGPRDLAAADLDGDGAIDVALVNGASFSGTSTFFNNGDGTFASRVDYAVPYGESLVIAELNGDTHPDLAWTNGFTGGLSIQFGVGDGTFGPNVDHPAGWSTSLTAADLNGDGATDLAAASDSDVTLLLNAGGGAFAPAVALALPAGFTYGLDAADFDADGGVDLLFARNKSTLGLLWSTGNGTFASPAYYVAGADPIAVTTGDLDGDGRPDVVLTNLYDVDGDNAAAVSVLLGNACLP